MENDFHDLFDSPQKTSLYDKKIEYICKKTLFKAQEVKIGKTKIINADPPVATPVIKIDKDGEVVQQIEITCRCGEKITLVLDYKE